MLNKQQSIALIIAFVLILAVFIGTVITIIKFEKDNDKMLNNLYPLATIVEEIHEANDLVTVRDFNGNLWQFYLEESGEDWEIGDICSIIFDSKGTEDIKDDEIISVRYSGWMEGWK